ncbi:transglutaminase domain-containing protein [Flammeovirga aprica]|uniref:Transglutaminase domain-containing protein n=1 Tax=Flammeovirga aprica JL-4 TaxID=694437 RepID=A0A7X9RSR1_9BACT|nr:transglutaminase domain-containing protein [Flammeovirga aprica]NME67545.1 transglutaminase domain-containing protein [Flammeovirga aprica JL-4]
MKLSNIKLLLFLFPFFVSCTATKNQPSNEKLIVKTKTGELAILINEGSNRHFSWRDIKPSQNKLKWDLSFYETSEKVIVKSDIDSVEFIMKNHSSKMVQFDFGNDSTVDVQFISDDFKTQEIQFDSNNGIGYQVKYQETPSKYLKELEKKYPMDLKGENKSDTETVLEVLHWVGSRWKHNGSNSPSKSDAITILDEVNEGQRFPCFAFAIVLRDQLSVLGYKARTIYLKTADAATSNYPSGHVATEVYLDDLEKWAYVDGQFNAMPMVNDIPLNAVEFQTALTNNYKNVIVKTLNTEPVYKNNFNDFIYPYLYYIETSLDNRYEKDKRFKIDGKRNMMLVPLGADNLKKTKFYGSNIDYCVYTNSLEDFYAKPNIENKDI